MRISLIKIITNKYKYYLNTMFIKSMTVSGALVSPNDIIMNS